MGFHKRIIHKENVLNNLHRVDELFKADALIMDEWSSAFFRDMSKKERGFILSLMERDKYMSFFRDDYMKIESMAECLIVINTNPGWYPILAALWKLKIPIEPDEFGKLPILKEKAIEGIIEFYETKKEA